MNAYIKLFEKLPPGYRERAIKYYSVYPFSFPLNHPATLQDALNYGFEWRDTPEGAHFWYSVLRWTRNGNELPVLPP